MLVVAIDMHIPDAALRELVEIRLSHLPTGFGWRFFAVPRRQADNQSWTFEFIPRAVHNDHDLAQALTQARL